MWIQTVSGLAFDFEQIEENEIRIEDIAHALSYINRFVGHVRSGGYSVAQHSVLVSKLVEKYAEKWGLDKRALAMRGLLHDASEAYLGDVSKPLKMLLPDYLAIEQRVEAMIEKRFGLVEDPLGLVKKADIVLLATEKRDLRDPSPRAWNLNVRAIPLREARPIRPLPPKAAKRAFLMRWVELGGERPASFPVERSR